MQWVTFFRGEASATLFGGRRGTPQSIKYSVSRLPGYFRVRVSFPVERRLEGPTTSCYGFHGDLLSNVLSGKGVSAGVPKYVKAFLGVSSAGEMLFFLALT